MRRRSLALCFCVWSGCVDPSQIVVAVTADAETSARAATLQFEVFGSDDPVARYDQTVAFDGVEGLTRLADGDARLTVVPRDADAERPFRIVATLRDGAGEVFHRRVAIVSGFIERQLAEVRLHFDDACMDVSSCRGRSSCALDGTSGLPTCTPACVVLSEPGSEAPSVMVSCGDDCLFADDGEVCGEDLGGRCWGNADEPKSCCRTCWQDTGDGTGRCLDADERSVDAAGIGGAQCVQCGCGDLEQNPEGGCLALIGGRSPFAGWQHACANFDTGLHCWGANGGGQVGVGFTSERVTEPTRVGSGVPLTLGTNHSCSSDFDSPTTCWGAGDEGQFGDGISESVFEPDLTGPTGMPFSSMASGFKHTCGIRLGELFCWGRNSDGAAGVGRVDSVLDEPVRVELPGEVTHVSSSRRVTCAVADEVIWCWGQNDAEVVTPDPDRLMTRVFEPQRRSPEGTRWRSVEVSAAGACGIRDDGRLWCWGNLAARLDPRTEAPAGEPIPIGVDTWRQVGLGSRHFCGIRTDGTLVCLGDNNDNKLGAEGMARVEPGPVGLQWTTLDVGHDFACARRQDDTIWCWGNDDFGQLGIDPAAPGFTPFELHRVCAP